MALLLRHCTAKDTRTQRKKNRIIHWNQIASKHGALHCDIQIL